MMTLYPAFKSSSEVCEPMNPRPPVTRMKLSLAPNGKTLFPKDLASESESGVVMEEREELSDKVDEDRELERRDMMSMYKESANCCRGNGRICSEETV